MQNIIINPLLRTELVEVVVGSTGGSEFILGQLPNLREAANIRKIESFKVGQVSNTPTGRPLANDTVFMKASLKLISKENIELRHISLSSISKIVIGTQIPELNMPQIDPEKSKIIIGSSAGLVAGEAFLLQITYEKRC